MTANTLAGRDLLTMADLTPAEVRLVLDRALAHKDLWPRRAAPRPTLAGKKAALVFMKPSLRTRVSFECACANLGIHPVVLGPHDAFSREETVHDTVKTLERYVDVIVLRTFEQAHVEEVAEHASVPVVNSLTDDHHPCQGLADLMTIEERFAKLAGLTLAYVGDGNNMANTCLLAGALTGMHVRTASPDGYAPAAAVVEQARALAEAHVTGATIAVGADPAAAVAGADVVVTDTWASMGQEAEHAERVAAFAGFTVDEPLFAQASEGAVFLHCLPAHRGEEVSPGVIDGAASAVFDEAENRLWAQQALLSLLLEGSES
ncbi:MAG: ornithine carbamoyltransferase [Actinobacteria bacterium]|nr:MAG: ornithine carbamoyltransferase [Actinomycetota bacterium]